MQYSYADAYTTSREKVISGAFASTMHLLFIALLVFGVNWQKKVEPQVNIVDLWSPPSSPAPHAAPPPPAPPKAEVKPEPPPPKVDPVPPKPVAKPDVAKPEIAMKDKEKPRPEKERRVVEDKPKETRKREDDAQAAQKAQQAETQRLANEQAAVQQRAAVQAAAAQSKLIEEYRAKIQARIYQYMQTFDDVPKDTFADVEITVLPDGNVLAAVIKKNSSSTKFNVAVERAIARAQPLPVPKETALFLSDFRRIDLTFKPKQ